jgi:hypothetical protein
MSWAKPAPLAAEPSRVLVLDDCVIVACDLTVIKLSKDTGRRLSSPFVLGAKCRHLSVCDGVVLAVGSQCFVLALDTMQCIAAFDCPAMFYDFRIVDAEKILGFARGKTWLYDFSIRAWIGGVTANSAVDASMDEVERLAAWEPHEGATSQWVDHGIGTVAAAYSGALEDQARLLHQMRDHSDSPAAVDFQERVAKTLAAKWHYEG